LLTAAAAFGPLLAATSTSCPGTLVASAISSGPRLACPLLAAGPILCRLLAALATGFRRALSIIGEVPARGLAAFAGDFALLIFVHRAETTVGALLVVRHFQVLSFGQPAVTFTSWVANCSEPPIVFIFSPGCQIS
jgi:hypothetical protein